VQTWAPSLPQSSVYLLRPHIFTGASVDNYMVGAFRGTPNGKGRWAEKLRAKGKRLPCMLPRNPRFREKKIQFVHVDDVARLIVHIAGLTEPENATTEHLECCRPRTRADVRALRGIGAGQIAAHAWPVFLPHGSRGALEIRHFSDSAGSAALHDG